jgi:hypothetical protein
MLQYDKLFLIDFRRSSHDYDVSYSTVPSRFEQYKNTEILHIIPQFIACSSAAVISEPLTVQCTHKSRIIIRGHYSRKKPMFLKTDSHTPYHLSLLAQLLITTFSQLLNNERGCPTDTESRVTINLAICKAGERNGFVHNLFNCLNRLGLECNCIGYTSNTGFSKEATCLDGSFYPPPGAPLRSTGIHYDKDRGRKMLYNPRWPGGINYDDARYPPHCHWAGIQNKIRNVFSNFRDASYKEDYWFERDLLEDI